MLYFIIPSFESLPRHNKLYRAYTYTQGHSEKLRGPGKRVKVGPQGQGGFHSESQLQPSYKLKTKKKGHYMLTMTIAASHQLQKYVSVVTLKVHDI